MVVSDSDSDFRLEEDDTNYEEVIPKKGSKKHVVECCVVYGCRGSYELKTHILYNHTLSNVPHEI